MTEPLTTRFRSRIGGGDLDVVGTVEAVSQIPYGRPAELSPEGVLADWRGTCSTKHMLLARLIGEAWPELPFSLWHRVYTVNQNWAISRWGPAVAETIPPEGLVDVHTFARVTLDAFELVIDVTFPVETWDGRSDMAVACGPGADQPAGADPLATKAALVARHCDPPAREAFLAALSKWAG